MTRTVCRGCDSKKLVCFLDLGEMPLAGGFLQNQTDKAETYPLKSYICEECGLIQILDVVDPDILFQNYSFSSTTVQMLVNHFHNYASWLQYRYRPELVVEFGSNDGVLQFPLEELGIKTVGVDVSENITAKAKERGLNVITGAFNKITALEIVDKYGKADVVTGSNVFAHNDCPESILEAAKIVLKPEGYLCLEVMYAGDLLEATQWDTLYHEHLTFYCLSTLSTLLNRYGFYVIDAERIPMHGGALRVVASTNFDTPITRNVLNMFVEENSRGIHRASTWVEFGKKSMRKINIVEDVLHQLVASKQTISAYGAAGKATMWVNACNMGFLKQMADSSPLRAGKFMPGTLTPIVLPEELKKDPPDYIFISAWNYANGIVAKESWYKGIWIVPLPDLKFF